MKSGSLIACVIICLVRSHFTGAQNDHCCLQTSEMIENLTSVVNQLSRRLDAISQSVYKCAYQDTCAPSSNVPQDCSDINKYRSRTNGVFQVYIPNNSVGPRLVYCDLDTPGQNWLVFQRRKDGSEQFERTWKEYADGFGNLYGEFYLGNNALYVLTNTFNYKLRIELEDFEGQKRYAEYSTFKIASPADNYRLTVSGYSGDAGDSFSIHSGYQFSTKDADHDTWSGNCAQEFHGAWWYYSCHKSNLNGLYLRGQHSSYADGVEWYAFRGHYYSLKFTEMKIARV